jgi:hypothetical protein
MARWKPVDINRARDLAEYGLSPTQIAEAMGTSSGYMTELRRNGAIADNRRTVDVQQLRRWRVLGWPYKRIAAASGWSYGFVWDVLNGHGPQVSQRRGGHQ